MADKLWVFDTQQCLEVYAPTLEAAEAEVQKFETASGVEYVLHHDWKIHQDDYEDREASGWLNHTVVEAEEA
jgi:hypothetical protein